MDIKQVNLRNVSDKQVAVYCDNRIALIEELQKLEVVGMAQLEIVVALLCLKGHGSICINGEQFSVKENDLLICRPTIVMDQTMVSADTQIRCICMSPEYMKKLVLISNNSWDIMKFLEKSPVIPLRQEETQVFCQYYDLLRYKLIHEGLRHHKEIVDSLIQAFLYEFHDVLERFCKLMPPKYTSAERLMKDFLELLASSYPKDRMVAAYAEKLHVTPKYLSAVCKECCGHTPSEIINEYVVKDIQFLLRKSEKSIKEISNELDFPNLSFFGKYVKRNIGVSPKQYRDALFLQE